MNDEEFDTALVTAAFARAAQSGWRSVTVARAALDVGLPLDRARGRFPSRGIILMRLGADADRSALAGAPNEGTTREKLFDLLMGRFDVLQQHRAGVLALLRALPADPSLGLLLALATRQSMRWMLDAAGVPTPGLVGALRVRGLVAVWLWAVRAWERDESADLAGTMAALDGALERAEQAARWIGAGAGDAQSPPEHPAETASPGETAIPPPPPDSPPLV